MEPRVEQAVSYGDDGKHDERVQHIEDVEVYGMAIVIHVDRAQTGKEQLSDSV